jgi:hypothetical protein
MIGKKRNEAKRVDRFHIVLVYDVLIFRIEFKEGFSLLDAFNVHANTIVRH